MAEGAPDALAGAVVASSFLEPVRRSRVLLSTGEELVVQHWSGQRLEPGQRVGVLLARRPVAVRAHRDEVASAAIG